MKMNRAIGPEAKTEKNSNIHPLKEFSGRVLRWRQPILREQYYELYGDGILVASLSMSGILKPVGIAKLDRGEFRLEISGLVRNNVTIEQLNPQKEIATYLSKRLNRGELNFNNGPSFQFKNVGILKNDWEIRDQHQRIICTVTQKGLSIENEAEVNIKEKVKNDLHLAMIILTAWCISVTATT